MLAEALRRCSGAVELVDLGPAGEDLLPAMRREPGVSSWVTVDPKTAAVYRSPDEVPRLERRVFSSYVAGGMEGCMRD